MSSDRLGLLRLLNFSVDENMSMDECISRNSLELNSVENRRAARLIFHEDSISRCLRISVKGYDPADCIKIELHKIFSLCGFVHEVELLNGCAIVYLMGEGAEERVLGLNGHDMGGWYAVIQSLPKKERTVDPDQVAELRAAYDRKNLTRRLGISVQGYVSSLPVDDVKDALIKRFCSCGEMTSLAFSATPRNMNKLSKALIYFYERGAAEKALALNGSYMGGRKIVIEALPEPSTQVKLDPFCRYYGSTVRSV